MDKPNATPTRADVLREFFRHGWQGEIRDYDQIGAEAMADEVLRLRAQRDAMIRRVKEMPSMVLTTGFGEYHLADSLSRSAVLAALREGGDDGH